MDRPKTKPTYHTRGKDVYQYQTEKPHQYVCTAKSNTYAVRIARALDQYQPDRRGQ
jgi:hypothetical protein